MERERLERLFSKERLKPYYNNGQAHESAIKLYKTNIILSESFFCSLSVLEITLRNSINNTCRKHFKDEFWFKNKLPYSLTVQVEDIENKIIDSNRIPTSDRIISELTFGFWTSLFNRNYAKLLWKPLHQIFVNTPHHLRQRAIISPRINDIRNFRNRVYHYEPICWNLAALQHHHDNIIEILSWLDFDIVNWITDIDRFSNLINEIRKQ